MRARLARTQYMNKKPIFIQFSTRLAEDRILCHEDAMACLQYYDIPLCGIVQESRIYN